VQPNPTQGVISEAWTLYQRHWRHLITIAAVVYVGLALVGLLLGLLLSWLGVILAALLSIVGVFWVQGALTKAVEDIRDGRADLSIGESFRAVQGQVGAIAGASILAGIAIGIGLLLLIVPGLYLITIWSLIVPAIVLGGARAMESFGRSRQLVRGHEWNVFGVVVLAFLIQVAFQIVLQAVLIFVEDSSVRSFLSNVIGGSVTAPFVALTWTLIYFRLTGSRTTPA
jgi:hypothetical protein